MAPCDGKFVFWRDGSPYEEWADAREDKDLWLSMPIYEAEGFTRHPFVFQKRSNSLKLAYFKK
ncbi:hypothetical protein GCM10011396_54770 [Undibacterium terreum]|uniref:Uncharacterized protein n=1 Tax=Undibacterium terreum TaxID=1224302 RepID=A0A916V0S3_9BURK|nr:hypothetical protein GCM10011396_54770 [Undibacterium terreum]